VKIKLKANENPHRGMIFGGPGPMFLKKGLFSYPGTNKH
jgi:hypothetical protein